MISASADFATAITAADREIRGYLKFNGTTVFRGADGLVSIQYNNALLDEERISVGCACSSYCVCEWYNNLTGVSLANSYFDAYVGVVESYAQTKPVGSIEDDTAVVEYIKLGRFYITDIERGKATTKVTAYDALSKASGTYTPTVVAGQSGYSVTDIINDIKTQTGITGTITGTAYVDTIYASTGREQLGWLCSVLYKDGSSFVIDRTTNDLTAVNFVKNTADLSIDDTTIYMDGVEDKPTFTVNSVEMGTESNTYTAGNGLGISRFNPYANQTIVDSIYSDVHGMAFVPMRLHFRGDPRIELGDLLSVTTDNNTYLVTVMKQTLTFNGGMECTIECFGNTEAHYIMSQSPTQAEFKRVDNAIADIAARIENPKNGIITTIKDADGYPTEQLILNSMDKDTATSVWRFNINGLAHSTAYTGGTYSFALDDNGNINANLLRVGTIADRQGKNSWNLDTGAFTITDGSINITTANDSDDIIKLNQQTSSVKHVTSEMTPSWLKNEYHYNNGTQDTTMGVLVKTNDSEPVIKAYRSIDRNPVGTKGSGDFWYSSELDHRFLRFRQAAQSYEESDATLRFSLSGADGTMGFYDENGTHRLSLSTRANDESQNGLTFRNASNVVTAKLGATTGITLGDGSTSYDRTTLGNTGLTFRDSSNNITASYPATGLWTKDVRSANMADYTTFTRSSIQSGSDGNIYAATTRLLSALIPVEPNTQYYIDTSNASRYVYEVEEYNSDRAFTGYVSYSTQTATYTTGASTYFIRILVRNSDNSTITPTYIPNIYMRKNTGLTGYSPYSEWGADLAERFAFCDWQTGNSLTDAEILSLLNTYNLSMPIKKHVLVRIFGPSGANQTLIVNKASDNYGAAWPVGNYSMYRYYLANGTWTLQDYYNAVSTAASWYVGRVRAGFRVPATFTDTGSYHPALDMKSRTGDWSIGVLNNDLYFVFTTDTNYSGGSNTTYKYKLPYESSEGTFSLVPTHISGSATTSFTANTYKYTGVSFTVPAGKFFSVTAHAYYSSCSPSAVGISDSSTAINQGHLQIEHLADSLGTRARCTWTGYLSSQTTYYLWAKSTANGNLGIGVDGFYLG